MRPLTRLLAFAVALVLLPSLALADITGTARVIDGDTIEIAGQRIRLHDIAAPESDFRHTWGKAPVGAARKVRRDPTG